MDRVGRMPVKIIEIWRHGLPGRTYFFSIRHKRSATHFRCRFRVTPIVLATQSQLRLDKSPAIKAIRRSGAAFPAEKKVAHIRKSSPLPRALQSIHIQAYAPPYPLHVWTVYTSWGVASVLVYNFRARYLVFTYLYSILRAQFCGLRSYFFCTKIWIANQFLSATALFYSIIGCGKRHSPLPKIMRKTCRQSRLTLADIPYSSYFSHKECANPLKKLSENPMYPDLQAHVASDTGWFKRGEGSE